MAAKRLELTCDEVEELAGAYALDALPADEALAVDAHLETCPNSHAAVRELGETAALLAFAAPPEQAPAGLDQRILHAALSGGYESLPARTAVGDSRVNEPKIVAFSPGRMRSLEWLVGVAAAFALLALGLGVWGFSQHRALTSERAVARTDGAVLQDLTSGSALVQTQAVGEFRPALIVQPPDSRPAYMVLDWPSAGNGKTYQAWLISAGQKPVSAGVFDGGPNAFQIVRLGRSLAGAQALAVTVEPSGGSAQPTTQPFIIRALSI